MEITLIKNLSTLSLAIITTLFDIIGLFLYTFICLFIFAVDRNISNNNVWILFASIPVVAILTTIFFIWKLYKSKKFESCRNLSQINLVFPMALILIIILIGSIYQTFIS